jgi:hypothetical protein
MVDEGLGTTGEGLRRCDSLGPPLRRHSYCPVENCEKQRLDCDSMLVEPKMRDGAEGIFGAGSAARVPNTGPSTYIPNKQFLVRVQRSSYVL